MSSNLINIYYDLYDILDDDELFINAIKHFTKTNKFKSALNVQLSNLRLTKIEKELNQLYDTPIKDLKKFAMNYKLKQKAKEVKKYQSSIFDFI